MKLPAFYIRKALAFGVLIISSAALADDVQLYSSGIFINKSASASEVIITVSGPNGFSYRSSAESRQSNLSLNDLQISSDGLYRYEVQEYAYRGERIVDDPANGREQAKQKIVDLKTSSGHFRVKNGLIVTLDETIKEQSGQ